MNFYGIETHSMRMNYCQHHMISGSSLFAFPLLALSIQDYPAGVGSPYSFIGRHNMPHTACIIAKPDRSEVLYHMLDKVKTLFVWMHFKQSWDRDVEDCKYCYQLRGMSDKA